MIGKDKAPPTRNKTFKTIYLKNLQKKFRTCRLGNLIGFRQNFL